MELETFEIFDWTQIQKSNFIHYEISVRMGLRIDYVIQALNKMETNKKKSRNNKICFEFFDFIFVGVFAILFLKNE